MSYVGLGKDREDVDDGPHVWTHVHVSAHCVSCNRSSSLEVLSVAAVFRREVIEADQPIRAPTRLSCARLLPDYLVVTRAKNRAAKEHAVVFAVARLVHLGRPRDVVVEVSHHPARAIARNRVVGGRISNARHRARRMPPRRGRSEGCDFEPGGMKQGVARDAPHLEGVSPPVACIRADGGHRGGGVLESPRIPVAVVLYVLATPAIAARHRLTVTFLGTCAFASCQATATDVYAQRSRGDIRSCLSCSF